MPEEIKKTAELMVYAVDARYPGDYDPVTESEYVQALAMAERVIKWAQEIITQTKKNMK